MAFLQYGKYLRRLLIYVVSGLLLLMPCEAMAAKEDSTRDDRILSNSEYTYWDRGGRVEIGLELATDSLRFFESLLRFEGNDGERYNLILSTYPGAATELMWVSGSDIERHPLPRHFAGKPERLIFSFRDKKVTVAVADTLLSLSASGYHSNGAYRVRLAPGSAGSPLKITGARAFRNLSENEGHTNHEAWYWIGLVLLVDALVFLLVHLRRHRNRKLRNKEHEPHSLLGNAATTVVFPTKAAIYLFGELQVLDKEGREVSGRFSPLMRQLFLLLLITTPDGGISGKKLTETLWLGKDEASAKNNRAVNLHKLRSILSEVGNCRIDKTDGKWQIHFDGVYVDYYECLSERLQSDKLTPDRIRILAAMTAKGGLLPASDYLWLDKYKSRVADSITNALLKYATENDDSDHYVTNLQISDILFSFDATNEAALRLKCHTYQAMGKQYLAKRDYEYFCRIYREHYGEPYPHSFSHILSR